MSHPTGAAPSALEGIRILEIASERGVLAGKLLADMGADVVTIEPPRGSAMRSYAPFVDDRPDPEKSLYWWHYNTSKRGVTLDLESPRGRELFLRLVASADAVLECEDPGQMARLGLDYPDLAEVKSDVIVVSLTPFGRDTAKPDAQVTDLTVLAAGGPVWSCGYDDHSIPPVRGGGNQGFQTGAHYAVLSLLTALLHRGISGEGQHIDVSLHAAANATTEMASYCWLVAQDEVQRQTGRHAMAMITMPTQSQCADGRYVTTGIPPRWPHEFSALHAWLVRLGLVDQLPEAIFLEQAAEKEFIDFSLLGQDDEVNAIMGAGRDALLLIARNVSAHDFFIGAQECGLSAGAVYAPEEVIEDPHFKERGFPVRVEHPEIGRTITYPGAPYRFNGSPWRISRRAPTLGEHNDEVLGELGVTSDERAKLRADGIV
ncbi:MAG: CoA transferase [Deltaproteobacteria bacterium]|nr:CoA transferase [Deltaproteobacteria bacterium]MBW2362173.1 CoA transferase [Deltaproteobacteria bacterium]